MAARPDFHRRQHRQQHPLSLLFQRRHVPRHADVVPRQGLAPPMTMVVIILGNIDISVGSSVALRRYHGAAACQLARCPLAAGRGHGVRAWSTTPRRSSRASRRHRHFSNDDHIPRHRIRDIDGSGFGTIPHLVSLSAGDRSESAHDPIVFAPIVFGLSFTRRASDEDSMAWETASPLPGRSAFGS